MDKLLNLNPGTLYYLKYSFTVYPTTFPVDDAIKIKRGSLLLYLYNKRTAYQTLYHNNLYFLYKNNIYFIVSSETDDLHKLLTQV